MTAIWKYVLDPRLNQDVKMPGGAIILSAHNQGDTVCLWARVNPAGTPESRIIEVFATGQKIPDGTRKFIGTVLMFNGDLVWHVFERLQ